MKKTTRSPRNLTASQAKRLAPQAAVASTLDPDIHLIRLQLARPPQERTHFLRVPLPTGGSAV